MTPTADAVKVKDDEVDSGGSKVKNLLSPKSSQRFIQGVSKSATPLSPMMKTTGSSEVSALRAFGADDDEVVGVGGGGGEAETVEISSKSRKSKNPTKSAKSKKHQKIVKG